MIEGRASLVRVASATTILIAIVMTIASLIGIVSWREVYRGIAPDLVPLFVGQDVLNLIVGLPVLLVAWWLARRGGLIGLLLWPGALFYVVYDYAYYVLGAPFNALFVPYLAVVTLGAYAAVGVVIAIDRDRAKRHVAPRVPSRAMGWFMIAIAALFALLWTAMSVSASISGVPLDMVPRVVSTLDLTIQLPALFVAGVLLLRREPLGYATAPGLLLQAAAYLIGLSALTALGEMLANAPFDPIGVLPGIVIGAISLAFIGFYVRAADDAPSAHAPARRTGALQPLP